jgi:hypothetical protein
MSAGPGDSAGAAKITPPIIKNDINNDNSTVKGLNFIFMTNLLAGPGMAQVFILENPG